MKNLADFGICDKEWNRFHSELCDFALSIEYPNPTFLASYIDELCFSYVNQWQIIVDAYGELETLIRELNALNDDSIWSNLISPYDRQSIYIETKCRDYTYLIIISIKSFIDLFACLIDVIINKTVRSEKKMVDISNIKRELQNYDAQHVLFVIEQFLEDESYLWIQKIKLYRDRLIHRGYRIKPIFSFQKTDEFYIQFVKGISSEEEIIPIGELFKDFIQGFPEIEHVIIDALQNSTQAFNDYPKVEFHYKSSGGSAKYFFKGIEVI